MKRASSTILILLLSFTTIFGEYTFSFNPDTLLQSSDSLINQQDTLKTKTRSDIDAIVYSNATDSLTFDVLNKKMYIYGKGEIKYKTSEMKSGNIFVDFETNDVDAVGVIDSTDSAGVKMVDTPVLSEAGEVYEGNTIKYNFKTLRGFISMAKNEGEDSRYEGDRVKKVDKDTYFIEDGMFTTCENDTPHTYFTASKMKVIQKDKIFAHWIFMHVGGVPLPIPLPFAVFPNETGRRSGIIAPIYGSDRDRGQSFRNFGYFFALSDYTDLTTTGDYYTRGGYGARSLFRYKKRYNYNGVFAGGISRVRIGEDEDPDLRDRQSWDLRWSHNQDLNPTTKLSADMQFISNSYLEDNSTRLNDLTQQDIVSNATFTKRWDESKTNLTVNYNRTQNLSTGSITENLPNLSFNKSQTFPFKREGVSSRDQQWYEYLGYTYSGQFRNERKKYENQFNIRGGFRHNISLNASPKLGYFSVLPSIKYTELWYDKRIKKEWVDGVGADSTKKTLVDKTVHEINFVRNYDFSLSASTKLYGMAQTNMLGIEAFRHIIEPGIGYNFTPDFSDKKYGYYSEYVDTSGKTIRYDKYQKGIFGGAGIGEKQSISFTLGNVFEMKTSKDPNDTTSQAKKIQLLNLSASTGYNFALDSLNLSDLSLTYRTQIGSLLNFSGSSNYTFYDYRDGSKVNTFLSSVGKGLMRMKNFSLNVSTSLSGDKISGKEKSKKKSADEDEEYQDDLNRNEYNYLREEVEPDFSIPWNMSVNYRYNYSKSNPDLEAIISSGVGLNFSMSLTEKWKLTFSGNYDFIEKKLNTPMITVYRDLHCWEMNFTWNPIGRYRGFRFELRLKAPELSDIKVTKSKDIYSGLIR